MFRNSLVILTAAGLGLWGVAAAAADVAAGQTKADEACGDCHDAADWEGEDVAAIEALIKDVASGAVKHKTKLDLTDAEIANIAAYWAGAGG